jgi:hypothetical protein
MVVCLLALPAIAWGETAKGSTEALNLQVEWEHEVPSKVTVAGVADGRHRLFVYREEADAIKCPLYPDQEQMQESAAALTGAEGEPLAVGPFATTLELGSASAGRYGICAYLDETTSAVPDALEVGCYVIQTEPSGFPESCATFNGTLSDYETIEAGSQSLKEIAVAEEQKNLEEAAKERKHREELEKLMHPATESAATEESRRPAHEGTLTIVSTPPERCTVPPLRHHTLAGVRRLLKDAHCRLGRVTRHANHDTLIVVSQNPRHGKTLPRGSAVAIVLGLPSNSSR